jgi:hypothetical protein
VTHARRPPPRRFARAARRPPGRGGGPEVRRLPEDQLLVARGLVDNPATHGGHKAAARVPGPGGYKVYVSRRTPAGHAERAGTGQRAGPWDAPPGPPADGSGPPPPPPAPADAGGPPRVRPGELAMEWRGTARDGRIVQIRATCGSPEVVDEVNRILDAAAAVLLD